MAMLTLLTGWSPPTGSSVLVPLSAGEGLEEILDPRIALPSGAADHNLR